MATVYRKINNMKNVSQIPINILNWRTQEAIAVIRNWGSGTCVEFNPKK
jgi:hypothetical protein